MSHLVWVLFLSVIWSPILILCSCCFFHLKGDFHMNTDTAFQTLEATLANETTFLQWLDQQPVDRVLGTLSGGSSSPFYPWIKSVVEPLGFIFVSADGDKMAFHDA